jgi:hypothetical protein
MTYPRINIELILIHVYVSMQRSFSAHLLPSPPANPDDLRTAAHKFRGHYKFREAITHNGHKPRKIYIIP